MDFEVHKFVIAHTQDCLIVTGYDVEHGAEPWVMHFGPRASSNIGVEADEEHSTPSSAGTRTVGIMMTTAAKTFFFSPVLLFTGMLLQLSTF